MLATDQTNTALRLIAFGGCKRYARGNCHEAKKYSPYAWPAEQRWCDACIAKAALDGTLPARPANFKDC